MNFVMIAIPAMIAIFAILSLKRHKFDEEEHQVEHVKVSLSESGNA